MKHAFSHSQGLSGHLRNFTKSCFSTYGSQNKGNICIWWKKTDDSVFLTRVLSGVFFSSSEKGQSESPGVNSCGAVGAGPCRSGQCAQLRPRPRSTGICACPGFKCSPTSGTGEQYPCDTCKGLYPDLPADQCSTQRPLLLIKWDIFKSMLPA